MKKVLLYFLPVALLVGSCARLEIENTDPDSGSSSGGTTALTDPELAWSASSFEATIGGSNTFPTLTNSYGVSVSYTSSNTDVATLASDDNEFPTLSNPNGLSVTYSTSDETVAAIDASTGEITLVGEGTVAIYATSEADDTYAAGSASYTLKVVKQEVSLSWDAASFSVVLEEGSSSYPVLTVSPSAIAESITYASSNTGVATIGSDGSISLAASGSTVISATYAGSWNALHNGSSYMAAFKAPSGVSSVAVSAPSLKSGYKGVSVGSTTYCNGIWAVSGISGGSSVSLSSYSGGGMGGGGNQGGPGGGGPGGH